MFGMAVIFSSCAVPTNRPKIDWYMADPINGSIVGPKTKKSIFSKHKVLSTRHQDFGNYACLHKEDFKGLVKYLIELERPFVYGGEE